MSTQPYPEHLDCLWLASDSEGYLGAFITAGAGPIPMEALNFIGLPVVDTGDRLCQLPAVSKAQSIVSFSLPDDVIDLAERGIFVYDWSDVHRTKLQEVKEYELYAVPTKPITVASLPSDLESLARAVKLANIKFTDGNNVDIRAQMICCESEFIASINKYYSSLSNQN